jgi:hypothetical protein
VSDPLEGRFLCIVLEDPLVAEVLRRAPGLALDDWWLVAGVLVQTVWNRLTGRSPGTGIRDADLFYLDPDTSWDAEDAVIRRGARLFGDLPVPVEIRNQARVHLWYSDHFAAVCCSVGVALDGAARPRVYAPHGLADVFGMVVRPNRTQAPRHLYEAKAVRWQQHWPELTVLPWDAGTDC